MIVEINLWKNFCMHLGTKNWVLYKYIYDIISHYAYSTKMTLCTKKYKIRVKIHNVVQQ